MPRLRNGRPARKLLLVALLAAAAFAFHRSTAPADPRGAHVTRFTLTSRLLRRDLHEIAVAPRGGGRGRPVLVVLHGRSGHPGEFLSSHLFAELIALGRRAPDIVLLDGGNHSYYHDRADGPWGSSILREAIPAAIARLHADPSRVAITGFSMGGFGALDLAIHHPGRFCAAGGEDAAMWSSAGETPSGAFDDAEDFARNDVIGLARARQRPFGRTRVWIGVGRSDPFYAADMKLASLLRLHGQPSRYVETDGDHSFHTFWKQAPQAWRFFAATLARC